MTARQEVEEILEQYGWCDRNQMQRDTVYMPPAEAVAAYERREYRDCPLEYEVQARDFWRDGWIVFWALVVLAILAAVVWNWPHHH